MRSGAICCKKENTRHDNRHRDAYTMQTNSAAYNTSPDFGLHEPKYTHTLANMADMLTCHGEQMPVTNQSESGAAHMLKQPGHLTSMKNEFGLCTRRLSLCRRCSSSLGGCSKSMSPMEICTMATLLTARSKGTRLQGSKFPH